MSKETLARLPARVTLAMKATENLAPFATGGSPYVLKIRAHLPVHSRRNNNSLPLDNNTAHVVDCWNGAAISFLTNDHASSRWEMADRTGVGN